MGYKGIICRDSSALQTKKHDFRPHLERILPVMGIIYIHMHNVIYTYGFTLYTYTYISRAP